MAQTVSLDKSGILVRVAALGAPSFANRHIIYIRPPLRELLGRDQRLGVGFQENVALLVVPPPISLADGDELLRRGVECSRKSLVRFYISDLRLMRRRLPVLVGCYGCHITDYRFDGFWAAASRALRPMPRCPMALLLGALFAKL